MTNELNNPSFEIFSDLNLYIQKTGNLEGADINIIDLEYNETTGIIEALVNKILTRPFVEYIKELNIAISEIEELENKGISLFNKVSFHSTEKGIEETIPSKDKDKYIEEFYNKTRIEHYILKGNLKTLINRLEKRLNLKASNKQDEELENAMNSKVILDRFQIPLLFSYMQEIGMILDHSQIQLSKILHNLTGHSPQRMRQYGFSDLDNVKKDIARNKSIKNISKNYNLNKVKDALTTVITLIDADIKSINKLNSSKL